MDQAPRVLDPRILSYTTANKAPGRLPTDTAVVSTAASIPPKEKGRAPFAARELLAKKQP